MKPVASHEESFTACRRLLFDIAYRMLGRVAEAEDMVQEAWLRWQRQDAAAVQSPRAWLVATTTRLCIDQLRSAQRARTDYYGVWLPEPIVEDKAAPPSQSAEMADSLAMAFMMMLDHLAPMDRAVYLLREAFGYDYAEIARIVEKSEASCRQIVSRAKTRFGHNADQPPIAPSEHAEQIVRQFLNATVTGDVRDLLALLTEDATLYSDGGGRVVAVGRPIITADRISRFFVGIQRWGWRNVEFRLARVNGRVGALVFSTGQLVSAFSFELAGDHIQTIFVVRNPEKLRHVPADPAAGDLDRN